MTPQERIKILRSLFSSFTTYSGKVVQKNIEQMRQVDSLVSVSESFYMLVNLPANKFEFISKNIEPNLGYTVNEIHENGGVTFLLSKMHPDDAPVWLKAIEELMHFVITKIPAEKRANISSSYNYRIQKKNGDYVTLLEHIYPVYFDDNKIPVMGIAHCIVSDITAKELPIVGTIRLLNNENSYETLFYKNYSSNTLEASLTNREVDVLRLIANGKTSKEIGDMLCISPHTVDSHRRKLLKKMNFKSTGEIIQYYKDNMLL